MKSSVCGRRGVWKNSMNQSPIHTHNEFLFVAIYKTIFLALSIYSCKHLYLEINIWCPCQTVLYDNYSLTSEL